MKDKKHDETCSCDECKDECACKTECQCEACSDEHECSCGDECSCDENCSCGCEHEKPDLAEEYLNMARVIQADFDNYRKRTQEQLVQAKEDGKILAIEAFLPALDSFKEAKKMITDEKVLEGVEMIEKKILSTLESLGVEKIEAEGKPFDHNLHNAIAVINDNSLEDGVIKTEFQAGYKFKDKVIRYSQVIVNKKEEN